jgi:hypothetical protein
VHTLPHPISCLSPDGQTAYCIDFAGIHSARPGYGYAGVPDFTAGGAAPKTRGIRRMEMRTGSSRLIYSVDDATRMPPSSGPWPEGTRHWLYQPLVAPSGSRVAFIHCSSSPTGRISSRIITMGSNGEEPYVLDNYGRSSHYVWRDDWHILAWSHQPRGKGFYLFQDQSALTERVGEGLLEVDGHCTFLPDRRWVLSDTYPDQNEQQIPYLFDLLTRTRHPLASFTSSAR